MLSCNSISVGPAYLHVDRFVTINPMHRRGYKRLLPVSKLLVHVVWFQPPQVHVSSDDQ